MIHKQIFINQPVQQEVSPLMLHRKPGAGYQAPGTSRLVPFIFLLLCFILPKPVSAQVEYPIFNDSSVWNVLYEQETTFPDPRMPAVSDTFTITCGFSGGDTLLPDGKAYRLIYGTRTGEFDFSTTAGKEVVGALREENGKIWAYDFLRGLGGNIVFDKNQKIGDTLDKYQPPLSAGIALVLDTITVLQLENGMERKMYRYKEIELDYLSGQWKPTGNGQSWIDGIGLTTGVFSTGLATARYRTTPAQIFQRGLLCYSINNDIIWRSPQALERYGCYYESRKEEEPVFAVEGAKWSVMVSRAIDLDTNFIPIYDSTTFQYYINGDSIINGVLYKKIFVSEKEDLSQASYFGGIREFQSKTYVITGNTEEKVLVDANWKVGDTLSQGFLDWSYAITILNRIDTIQFLGANRKKFLFKVQYFGIFDSTGKQIEAVKDFILKEEAENFFTAIEGVGFIDKVNPFKNNPHPGDIYFSPIQPGYLLCFSIDSRVHYFFTDSLCYISTRPSIIQKMPKRRFEVKVFPNPATNEIYLDLSSLESHIAVRVKNVLLFNVSGIHFPAPVISASGDLLKMDIQKLPAGFYFGQLHFDDNVWPVIFSFIKKQ